MHIIYNLCISQWPSDPRNPLKSFGTSSRGLRKSSQEVPEHFFAALCAPLENRNTLRFSPYQSLLRSSWPNTIFPQLFNDTNNIVVDILTKKTYKVWVFLLNNIYNLFIKILVRKSQLFMSNHFLHILYITIKNSCVYYTSDWNADSRRTISCFCSFLKNSCFRMAAC